MRFIREAGPLMLAVLCTLFGVGGTVAWTYLGTQTLQTFLIIPYGFWGIEVVLALWCIAYARRHWLNARRAALVYGMLPIALMAAGYGVSEIPAVRAIRYTAVLEANIATYERALSEAKMTLCSRWSSAENDWLDLKAASSVTFSVPAYFDCITGQAAFWQYAFAQIDSSRHISLRYLPANMPMPEEYRPFCFYEARPGWYVCTL